MEKIKNFMLPEHTNSLYDKEAISSIGLTRDIAGKINELIDAYNELSRMDLEWKQTQEGTIRKGVLFMKDNLLNSLNDLMGLLLESGFIDDRIKYHSVGLTNEIALLAGRLSTLLGSVTAGSTSMDAEIIDGRVGAKGEQYASIGNAIRGQFKNQAYTIKEVVTDANYKTVLPDADLIDEPCTYQLNFTWGATDLPANLPYEAFRSGVDELITFKDKYYRQILIGDKYLYTRYGVKQTDGKIVYANGWKCIFHADDFNALESSVIKKKGVVNPENYLEVLPDADRVMESCTYQLNFGWNSTDITANLPYTAFRGRIDELITFADFYYRQMLIGDKYIYTRNGILDSGGDSVDYGEWVCIWSAEVTSEVPEFIVSKSGGDYNSLTKCIHDNKGRKCVIHVRPGVYDLVSEGSEYFGSSFLEGTSAGRDGLPVDNGTQIFMDAGAVVQYLYNGANTTQSEYFSPFIMRGSGGEIHGGRIECQNCRYAIHDDVYDTSPRSKSVIEGVHIHYKSDRNVCIGGGFGQSSHITVRNCTIINGNEVKGYGIFYHNSASGNGQSYVAIENNYVDGPIVVESYGPSTKISTAIVSGNKCTEVRKIVEGSVDNIKLYEFNNATE